MELLCLHNGNFIQHSISMTKHRIYPNPLREVATLDVPYLWWYLGINGYRTYAICKHEHIAPLYPLSMVGPM